LPQGSAPSASPSKKRRGAANQQQLVNEVLEANDGGDDPEVEQIMEAAPPVSSLQTLSSPSKSLSRPSTAIKQPRSQKKV
jgi:hypothetical protein